MKKLFIQKLKPWLANGSFLMKSELVLNKQLFSNNTLPLYFSIPLTQSVLELFYSSWLFEETIFLNVIDV